MANYQEAKKLSLEQFKATREPAGVEAILSRLNGGSFMKCHQMIFEQTGLWIPELVPVFQKLDAALLIRELPANLQS
jgi:hypothetical protein